MPARAPPMPAMYASAMVAALAGGVLLDGDQAGHALAGDVQGAHRVPRALGRRHEHVHVRRRHDLLVADVEAVREGDRLALGEVGGDVLLVHVGLTLVVDEDHDDVRRLRRFGHGHDGEAVLFRHGPGLAALAQADDHVAAGVAQVQRVGVALRAVADDGDLLAVELAQVAVLLIVHSCHSQTLLFPWSVRRWCIVHAPARPCRCAPVRGCRIPSGGSGSPAPCSRRR